jgi:hypothetical protein
MPELNHAPAFIWRAFFIFAWLGGTVVVAAPAGSNATADTYLQVGKPDQGEGRRVLAQFQRVGIAGEYYLEFEIRVMPRRGDERRFRGRLWGARNEQGAILRVSIKDAAGQEHRLLIQNGVRATVWRSDSPTSVARIVGSLEPLVPGVELTAFELQMPYIYWPDATLESVTRVRSRPAHVFLFRPPADWAAEHPEVAAVRAYLDTQFHAPVQTELLDAHGRVSRTLSLVDLKKIGDQYIVKSIDLRNEATRDKTRLQVTAAALGLEFAAKVFEPAGLNEEIASPASGRLTRVAP